MAKQGRVIGYIDGFNFYYGAVEKQPAFKWLDFQGLCEELTKGWRLLRVNYYTARVDDRLDDLGQSQRQDVYLRALATRPKITIVYGQFRTNTKTVPLADRSRKRVKARVTEEKGSDVNLATDLVWDACHHEMECALVFSNDFDLQRPIERVIGLGLEVITVNPHRPAGQRPSVRGSDTRNLRLWHLRKHQLPDTIHVTRTRQISRPPAWR